MQRLSIRTASKVDFQDITARVQEIVSSSGIDSGVCYIYVPHTTAAVTINEHADPDVVADIAAQLGSVIPQHHRYRHIEGNSPAHIKATLLGSSAVIFIDNGRLILGTWQGIFFCEFDGPRTRNILVKLIPDTSPSISKV
ncbi:secondary thiamine-phosphate synthase enzyme YjbQ [Chloroflexota bacterium]